VGEEERLNHGFKFWNADRTSMDLSKSADVYFLVAKELLWKRRLQRGCLDDEVSNRLVKHACTAPRKDSDFVALKIPSCSRLSRESLMYVLLNVT
jgi:hypothetical protein